MGQDLQYQASPQTYFEGQFILPSLMNTKSEGFFFFEKVLSMKLVGLTVIKEYKVKNYDIHLLSCYTSDLVYLIQDILSQFLDLTY